MVVTVWEPGLAYAAAMPIADLGMAQAPMIDVDTAREMGDELEVRAERIAHDEAELARVGGIGGRVAGGTRGGAGGRDDRRPGPREIGAAAIVIGSRGLSGLRARMEGSTSRAVR